MLRKIVSGLRRQDWAAVAIELIVVIAGVFIGVQASNWNEQRETNQETAVFTQRLADDMRKVAWMYELEIGYENQVLANAKRAADALAGKAAPIGDYAAIEHVRDHPCSSGLAPVAVAASVSELKRDPRLLALLQLHIAKVSTNVGLLTKNWDRDLREPLRRFARQGP